MTTISCFLTIKYLLSNTLSHIFVLKKCRETENSRITEVLCMDYTSLKQLIYCAFHKTVEKFLVNFVYIELKFFAHSNAIGCRTYLRWFEYEMKWKRLIYGRYFHFYGLIESSDIARCVGHSLNHLPVN